MNTFRVELKGLPEGEAAWDAVGGLIDVKRRLQEVCQWLLGGCSIALSLHILSQAIVWPLKHPEAFSRLGLKPPRGIILIGPPGCSKTTLVRTAARAAGLPLLAASCGEILSAGVGESEAALRRMFHEARESSPCLVFLDEIDSLSERRGMGGSEAQSVTGRCMGPSFYCLITPLTSRTTNQMVCCQLSSRRWMVLTAVMACSSVLRPIVWIR